jgi:hypothetical protein
MVKYQLYVVIVGAKDSSPGIYDDWKLVAPHIQGVGRASGIVVKFSKFAGPQRWEKAIAWWHTYFPVEGGPPPKFLASTKNDGPPPGPLHQNFARQAAAGSPASSAPTTPGSQGSPATRGLGTRRNDKSKSDALPHPKSEATTRTNHRGQTLSERSASLQPATRTTLFKLAKDYKDGDPYLKSGASWMRPDLQRRADTTAAGSANQQAEGDDDKFIQLRRKYATASAK